MPCHLFFLDSSTFEKDGSASLITLIVGFENDAYEPVANSTLAPIAGKALLGSAQVCTKLCTVPVLTARPFKLTMKIT